MSKYRSKRTLRPGREVMGEMIFKLFVSIKCSVFETCAAILVGCVLICCNEDTEQTFKKSRACDESGKI